MRFWISRAVGIAALLTACVGHADGADGGTTNGPAAEPGLVQRATDTVVSGAATARDVTVDATRRVVKQGERWVDQGKQRAGHAWSRTRDTTGELVDRSVEGVGAGVEYVRDGTGRVIDKSISVGGAAWENTQEYSAGAWEKSKAVTRSVKEELTGTDTDQAEVIDKTMPAQP
ncbi:MAG: hypothetical protein P1U54_04255 [Immundisolibacteraceae bacterium]|nr:hypothetical protein [Immundisolibacteraceae bacterium]